MRTHYFLLMTLFFLFSQMEPGYKNPRCIICRYKNFPATSLEITKSRAYLTLEANMMVLRSLRGPPGPRGTIEEYLLYCKVLFDHKKMLFSKGAGTLTSLGRRTDQYRCLQHGGFCLRSSCPSNTRLQGTCKPDKPNCCRS